MASTTDRPSRISVRALGVGLGLTLAAGCESGWDYDFRDLGAAEQADPMTVQTAPRPAPDARGVISYPNYQVVVARRGDTINEVATRVGLPASELARFNGIPENASLRDGEIVALPRRVATAAAPGSGTITPAGEIDIATLAGDAIERAEPQQTVPRTTASAGTPSAATAGPGPEPVRHKVERGETAYSIARLYNVTVRALADWNGLGPDMMVREGQYLLIPVPERTAAAVPPADTARPGQGSVAPVPPSAAAPLPSERTVAPPETPPAPQLPEATASATRFAMPAAGSIIRGYEKGKNEGIDIAAAAGSPVKAASAGTVAAITQDTDEVPILVLRHPDNLLTVYANIDDIAVKKGDSVSRGQTVAKVRAGTPAFLHFELRKGFDSIDPMPYLTP